MKYVACSKNCVISHILKVREIILLLSILGTEDWNQFPLLRNDSSKIISLNSTFMWYVMKVREMILLLSFLRTEEWNQFPLLRNDSSKIISLTLTFMWYVIGVYILLIGNVDAIILRNEDW